MQHVHHIGTFVTMRLLSFTSMLQHQQRTAAFLNRTLICDITTKQKQSGKKQKYTKMFINCNEAIHSTFCCRFRYFVARSGDRKKAMRKKADSRTQRKNNEARRRTTLNDKKMSTCRMYTPHAYALTFAHLQNAEAAGLNTLYGPSYDNRFSGAICARSVKDVRGGGAHDGTHSSQTISQNDNFARHNVLLKDAMRSSPPQPRVE